MAARPSPTVEHRMVFDPKLVNDHAELTRLHLPGVRRSDGSIDGAFLLQLVRACLAVEGLSAERGGLL